MLNNRFIMTSFSKEFGDMITANFKLKAECMKKKKTISYCRRRMNRGLAIDTARMKAEIEQEIIPQYTRLEDELTTELCTYREILENDYKKQAYKDQLQAEHDDYEQYLESLTKTLDEMLHKEGVTLVWKMD